MNSNNKNNTYSIINGLGLAKKAILAGVSLSILFSIPGFAKTQTNTKTSYSSYFTPELQTYNRRIAQEMNEAIYNKKLIVPDYIKDNLKEISLRGYCSNGYGLSGTKTYMSRGLLNLLHNLLNSSEVNTENPLSILSLIRRGHNHGAINGNGEAICRAVDIDGYSGHRINMSNPNNSLKAIVKVISTMPAGNYNIGLPRPGGGSLIDPSRDYFLPVNSLSQNERSPTGTLEGDLKLIKNPQAKLEISTAIFRNKNAHVVFLMPDAVDHLHVKALSD